MFGDIGKLRGWKGLFLCIILSVNDYSGLLTVDALRSSLTLVFVLLGLCPYYWPLAKVSWLKMVIKTRLV